VLVWMATRNILDCTPLFMKLPCMQPQVKVHAFIHRFYFYFYFYVLFFCSPHCSTLKQLFHLAHHFFNPYEQVFYGFNLLMHPFVHLKISRSPLQFLFFLPIKSIRGFVAWCGTAAGKELHRSTTTIHKQ
jgi:hypothetical protein